ncbi:MAG: hypothetical protein ABSG43_12830 [Solirubrobacteraceae bacterium]
MAASTEDAARPMRFAFADPPHPGKAAYYHPGVAKSTAHRTPPGLGGRDQAR